MARVDILELAKKSGVEFKKDAINIIVPMGNDDVYDYGPIFEITKEMSVEHYNYIVDTKHSWHKDTLDYAEKVFNKDNYPLFRGDVTGEFRRGAGFGFKGVVGLIDLHLVVSDAYKDISIVWKYPEAGLHPNAQSGLADVLISLQSRTVERREYLDSWTNESEMEDDGSGEWKKVDKKNISSRN